MADSLTTTLLENIKVNLEDTTNFSAIANALKKVEISSEFQVPPKATPCAVVVSSPGTDETNYSSLVSWVQPVRVYIIMRRLRTRSTSNRVLGTSSVNGVETLLKDAAQALCRPSPYSDDKPSASYTTQTGVKNAEYGGKEIMGEEGDESMQDVTVGVLTVNYLCFDTRSV